MMHEETYYPYFGEASITSQESRTGHDGITLDFAPLSPQK